MARCCSNLFLNGLTDTPPVVTDPPEPPVMLNFYYTNVVSLGRSRMDEGANIVFSIDGLHPPDYVAAAGFLQAYVGINSGIMQNPLNGDIFVWVVSATEPVGWEWDADITAPSPVAVVWVNNGVAVAKCFNSGDLSLDPDTYYLAQVWTTAAASNGALDPTIPYSDGTFNAVYDPSIRACYGASATISVVTGVGTVNLTVNNTYCPVVAILSGGVSPQSDLLNIVACP